MVIENIHNIKRKNLLVAYRREYTAMVFIGLHSVPPKSYPFEFSVELTPLGSSVYRVKMPESLDLPTIPVMNLLKAKVHELDRAGNLP